MASRRNSRRRRNNTAKMVGIGALAIVSVFLLFYFLFIKIYVEPVVVREAGSEYPSAKEFFAKDYDNVSFVTDIINTVDMSKPGDYEIRLKVEDEEFVSTLRIKDTVAPSITTKNATAFIGTEVKPEDLVESIEDATAVTVKFLGTPDFSQPGTIEVEIEATDAGGNKATVKTMVTIEKDTEPPVISGVTNLSTTVGGSISYKKGVTVTDNLDDSVELVIDNSNVNLQKAGTYKVTYTATDASGNTTVEEATVKVKEPDISNVTEEYINMKADELLGKITNSSMSQYEVAKAIYNWVHDNIGYYDGTPKEGYVEGVYRGLINRKGDCYTYAMTSKCLLTRAGIKNMDIEKIPASSRHYWNLIDLGDGWYHFDTTRRKDGTTFFYWNDAKLMEYSNSHKLSHNYDPTKYPEIQ